MKQTTDLGRDKVWLLVLKLAVPSMIAQFVTVLYSIIDRMFIGNIPKRCRTNLCKNICGTGIIIIL